MSYTSLNPYSGEVLLSVPDATDAEIDAALETAHASYLRWRATPIAERVAVLARAADLVKERRVELGRLSTREMGRLLGESLREVDISQSIFDYYAENAEHLLKPKPVATVAGEAEVHFDPLGIVFAVEPWNAPFYQVVRVLAPQIAVGNAVILKHANIVPQCAQALSQLMLDAGLPEGVFTNVYATHAQSERIIADERVRGVTLTGSETAGSIVAAQAGAALTKSVLELGGSDAMIVLEDANLDLTVTCAAMGRMAQSGQICISPKRIIVVDSRYDEFLERYRLALSGLRGGDPLAEDTTVGPLSSRAAAERVKEQLRRAVDHGATLIEVGEPVPDIPTFVQPTILTGVERNNPIYYEEIFGPVPMVFRVADEAAALDLANDSPFGLAGSVYSEDVAHAREVAKRIETGMVWINTPPGTTPDLPFGGIKRSGYGHELGEAGLKEFANQKLIVTPQRLE